MKINICRWLKRKPVKRGSITPMVVTVLCLMGLLMIVSSAFSVNSSSNEIFSRFGIGIFVGGVIYAVSMTDKIAVSMAARTRWKTIVITAVLIIIGLIFIGFTANNSHAYCKVLNGIGISLLVGSISYFANRLETLKTSKASNDIIASVCSGAILFVILLCLVLRLVSGTELKPWQTAVFSVSLVFWFIFFVCFLPPVKKIIDKLCENKN